MVLLQFWLPPLSGSSSKLVQEGYLGGNGVQTKHGVSHCGVVCDQRAAIEKNIKRRQVGGLSGSRSRAIPPSHPLYSSPYCLKLPNTGLDHGWVA